MDRRSFRYWFSTSVPLEDVEATLLLSIWAAESLLGEKQVRLDANHQLDRQRRACVIEAGTLAGRTVNRLFLGYLRREFEGEAFRVERVEPKEVHP